MSLVKWASVIGVLIGLGLLHFTFTVESSTNWSPVSLPLPGLGHAVAAPFRLGSGGAFQCQVASPFDKGEGTVALPEIPPVKCALAVRITNENGFRLEQTITSIRRSGKNTACGIEYFVSDSFVLPERGDYFITVESKQDIERFKSAGGMFSLSRFEKPVEASIRPSLFIVLSYTLALLSVGGLLLASRRVSTKA